jgi:hypothetical protein
MSVFSTDFQQSQNIWHVMYVPSGRTILFRFLTLHLCILKTKELFSENIYAFWNHHLKKKIIWPFRKFYPVFRKQSQISQLIFNSLRFLNWFSTVSAQLGCVCHLDTPYFFVFCCLHVLFWRPMDYFTQIFMSFGSLIRKPKIYMTFEKILPHIFRKVSKTVENVPRRWLRGHPHAEEKKIAFFFQLGMYVFSVNIKLTHLKQRMRYKVSKKHPSYKGFWNNCLHMV